MKATGPSLPDIADRIRAVADFYTENKPTVRQIRMYSDDFKKLFDSTSMELHRYGFTRMDNGAFSYRDYDLIPVDGLPDAPPPAPPRQPPNANRR